MKLNIEKLENQAAVNWYRVFTREERDDTEDKKDFLFNITSLGLNLGNSSCTGLLTAFFREERVTQIEKHLKAEEILVALDGDSIVCMAPPGDLQPSAGLEHGIGSPSLKINQKPDFLLFLRIKLERATWRLRTGRQCFFENKH